jgi:hypothetical protein
LTIKQILDDLPFGPGPSYQVSMNPHFRPSLEEALSLYSTARKDALSSLYKTRDLTSSRTTDIAADIEEVAASCGHFSYSLQELADETKTFLSILEELKALENSGVSRSWYWLLPWKGKSVSLGKSNVSPAKDFDIYSESTNKVSASATRTLRYRLWKGLRFFRRDDVMFATKVGIGAAIYAMPSFIPQTRPIYKHWRGEWGLLSYMLVCSMTIGASTTVGLYRFFGTCIGATTGILAWVMSGGNPFALAFLSWLNSIPCFYIIVVNKQGPMGRFILLTYDLIALYAYSLSAKDDDHDEDEGGINPIITEIALHRVISVLSGCIWGLVISRLIWPMSARRKVREGLSVLFFRLSLIWRRDPLSALLEGDSPNEVMNLREEITLNKFLARLEGLRSAATSEWHLKGKFSNQSYARILKSSDRMLDSLHAMNVIMSKEPEASDGEARILRATNSERSELSARISHLFQVLASSMKLKFPLIDVLPQTDILRDRLLARTFDYRRISRSEDEDVKDEDFALIYAYALVTRQVSEEIKAVSEEIEQLFGVLDESLLKLE